MLHNSGTHHMAVNKMICTKQWKGKKTSMCSITTTKLHTIRKSKFICLSMPQKKKDLSNIQLDELHYYMFITITTH